MRQRVAVHDVAVGEDNVAEETGAFVIGDGFHDRLARAGQNFPRRFKVQQQRPETVAVVAHRRRGRFPASRPACGWERPRRQRARCPTCPADCARCNGDGPNARGRAIRRARCSCRR